MYPSNYPSSPQPGRRRMMPAIGIGVAGLVAGVAIAWGATAGASTTSGVAGSALAAATTGSTGSVSTGNTDPGGHGGYHAPGTSGTVTAVGASSVTIKTASGTTTYVVSSTSDVDKNGEAQLSDLKVGDAVAFDATTINGQQTIDHLHAGNETLDRPTGH